MTQEEVVDAKVIEEPHETLPVLAHTSALSIAPEGTAEELLQRLTVIKQAMRIAMEPNIDYGVIPGTGTKPTLLKPGAEKLCVLFKLDVQIATEREQSGDHLTVLAHATVFHAPTGLRLGSGEGVCSTRERKYAYRIAARTCPQCGHELRVSKKQGEGFYCWRKTGGCGATFSETDSRVTSQQQGQVENPDLPDVWNTVVKMARKRALTDAVLLTTGASAIFTQDLEDQTEPPPATESSATELEPEPLVQPERQPQRAGISHEAVTVLKELKAEAHVDNEWLRLWLISEGVSDVPDTITDKRIKALTPEQASRLQRSLAAEIEAREALRKDASA